jgi:hypothetical protein
MGAFARALAYTACAMGWARTGFVRDFSRGNGLYALTYRARGRRMVETVGMARLLALASTVIGSES